MTQPLVVCSYNLGINENSYFQMLNSFGQKCVVTNENQAQFSKKYELTEKTAASLLVNLGAKVFLLQEMGEHTSTRPFVQILKERNFQIYQIKGICGQYTSIAIDTNRFKNIKDHTFSVDVTETNRGVDETSARDITVVTATDSLTGQPYSFASVRIDVLNIIDDNTAEPHPKEAARMCREIAKKLHAIGRGTIQLVGADMYCSEQESPVNYEIFTKAGYQFHKTGKVTHVSHDCKRYKKDSEHEIDVIFAKTISSLLDKIKAFFCQSVTPNIRLMADPLGWDARKNGSNHLPVIAEIRLEQRSATIRLLCQRACQAFRRLFCKR